MSNVKGLTSIVDGSLCRNAFNTFSPAGAAPAAHVQAAWESEGPKTMRAGWTSPKAGSTPHVGMEKKV